MTRYRFAVLGDPVEQSRSPRLHAVMLELAGLEGEYLKIRADRTVLAETIEELRSGLWNGLNVTMPLKATAARLVDSLSPQAVRSGSVNTLVHEGHGIAGHSTDSTAFAELLVSERFADIGTVHVLGAGGSAAAALVAIPETMTVYVAARRETAAREVTARLGGETIAWGVAVPGALVINTTPVGMSGDSLPVGILETAMGLIDLPYSESPTPAVRAARRSGLPVADGHEFLIRQAVASFGLWTGFGVGFDQLMDNLRKT